MKPDCDLHDETLSIVDALTGETLFGYTNDPNIVGGHVDDEEMSPRLGEPLVATRDGGGGWLLVLAQDAAYYRERDIPLRCIIVTRRTA
jgi:hypothetical protein